MWKRKSLWRIRTNNKYDNNNAQILRTSIHTRTHTQYYIIRMILVYIIFRERKKHIICMCICNSYAHIFCCSFSQLLAFMCCVVLWILATLRLIFFYRCSMPRRRRKKKYRRSSVIVSVYVHTHLYIKVSLLSASLCFAVSQCDDKRREQQQPPKLLNGKRWKVFMGVSWWGNGKVLHDSFIHNVLSVTYMEHFYIFVLENW